MSFATGLFNTVMGVAAKQYQKMLGARLAAAGLRYDDLLIETDDVLKALDRIPPQELVERERRIKRAFDLSAKRKPLPTEYAPTNVFQPYLFDQVQNAKNEREEREILNH